MEERSILCLSLILGCLVISVASEHAGNETDKLSLLEFKAMINGDPLRLLRSWNDSVHFCWWPGITCSSRHHQRVTVLDVSNWQLNGQLSQHIGNLSFLKVLRLANNSFNFEIPPEIGRLSRLREIDFENNSFSGEIPANISGCSNLRFLLMVYNNLIGRIPREIGLMSQLRSIQLSANSLRGEIPASIGNLSLLEDLLIVSNTLHGAIPYSFGQLTSLKYLVLTNNQLTGTVPESLFNISSIEYFAVLRNRLEGGLPHNMGQTLPNLQTFLFGENNFSGTFPTTVSNSSNLVLFQIQTNSFTGNVPSFARFSNLKNFGAANNNLGYAQNGDLNFLRDIVNCTNLVSLSFENNSLGGVIPQTIGNGTRLESLTFGRNQISGNIPSGIGNLINLERLGLERNHLTGPIPSKIGKLRKLGLLLLQDNQLSGAIPSALQNLTLLSQMSLARNNLQGSITPSLGECRNLQALSLASNNLSGHIPSQLFRISSLTLFLDLSGNQLSGSIPMEVGKLVNLGRLDISENKLSGEIPKGLRRCISMEYLNLQGNFLQGSIPTELDSLKGVQVIDFSRNNLSGQIPMYFEEFRGLLYLNLSFNEFEGQVPKLGVFQNASAFSITGNPKLCGGLPELKLRACSSNKHKISHRTKLAIIVSCSIIGFILVLSTLVMLFFCSKKRNKYISESSTGISLPRNSYGDLSKATDGFSPTNLIGVGRFGCVYKGILHHTNLLVAVKVLNLHVSSALKSFTVECESLRVIKHRNLVKLVTVCSSIDFQGNEFKALVYEFMENGNLDEWLHSGRTEQQQSRHLNLIQRIKIAIDVATALEYLHHHCHEPIAHCDIKPSNILLNGDLVAHIGDFGLAKLLRSAVSSSSSNQTSSVGVRGTVGYVAPEYAMGSEVSTSGDIYSFGILLLEMFTGKRPTDHMFKDDFNLNSYASMALPERITEIVDPVLLEDEEEGTNIKNGTRGPTEAVHKSLVSIVEIGVACSSKYPGERRNISNVAAEIRDILNTLGRI